MLHGDGLQPSTHYVFLGGPAALLQAWVQALGPTVDELHGISAFHVVGDCRRGDCEMQPTACGWPHCTPHQLLTAAIGHMSAHTHLLHQLHQHVVLFLRPLAALQGWVVLLVLL